MSPKRKPKKRPTISTYFSSSSSPSAFATTQTQTSRRAKRQKITSNDDMEGDGDAELTPVQLAAHSQFQPSLIAPAAETMRGILAPDSAEIIINNDEEDVDDETTSTSLTRTTSTTLTPLHQQVLQLKSRHPGVLLMIEVGYKMR